MRIFHFSLVFIFATFLFLLTANLIEAETSIIQSTANADTKILRHTQDTLNNSWLDYNFDDSAWSIPSEVWDTNWYRDTNWVPTSTSLTAPNTGGWFTLRKSDIKVIQATSNLVQAPLTRDFIRRKFTVPANAQIIKAYLYGFADNAVKFWLNGTQIVGSGTSLNNLGGCDGNYDNQPGGGIWQTADIKGQVRVGNNILAGNLVNTGPCGANQPMSVQFALYIEYSLPSPVTLSGRVTTSSGQGISGVIINNGAERSSGVPWEPPQCNIGTATTDANGNFSFTNIPFAQDFCLRAPAVVGYSGPNRSYECQKAGGQFDTTGCGGSTTNLDVGPDNAYNFVYTPNPTPTFTPTPTPTSTPAPAGSIQASEPCHISNVTNKCTSTLSWNSSNSPNVSVKYGSGTIFSTLPNSSGTPFADTTTTPLLFTLYTGTTALGSVNVSGLACRTTGDLNSDGTLDEVNTTSHHGDLEDWTEDFYGRVNPTTDCNGNGLPDLGDFNIWRNKYILHL